MTLGAKQSSEKANNVSSAAEATGDVRQVSQSVEEITTGSIQINESVVELSKLAENLTEMVGRFKL